MAADQTSAPIRADMQWISVPRVAVFVCPTGLNIFLRTLCIAPLRHRVAFLDVRMLFAGSALDWRFDNTGSNDLSAPRNQACFLQLVTDRRADAFHQMMCLQTRTPTPDGFGSRDLSVVFQSQQRLNAAPVQYLIRQRIV